MHILRSQGFLHPTLLAILRGNVGAQLKRQQIASFEDYTCPDSICQVSTRSRVHFIQPTLEQAIRQKLKKLWLHTCEPVFLVAYN